jgi:hypothetical protein
MPAKKDRYSLNMIADDSLYVFVVCSFVVLIIWALFALGTQGSQPTKKKQGDAFSERGVSLLQALFYIAVVIGVVGVIASGR